MTDISRLAVSFVIDCSGSMTKETIDEISKVLNILEPSFESTDLIQCIAFTHNPTLIVPWTYCEDIVFNKIIDTCSKRGFCGGTDYLSAIKLALKELQLVNANRKLIYIFTDYDQIQKDMIDFLNENCYPTIDEFLMVRPPMSYKIIEVNRG